MKKPKVSIKYRLVLVFHASLKMFEVCKVGKNGTVNKNYKPRTSYKEDAGSACKEMDVPYSTFRSVKVNKDKCGTWNQYIEQAWRNALYAQHESLPSPAG